MTGVSFRKFEKVLKIIAKLQYPCSNYKCRRIVFWRIIDNPPTDNPPNTYKRQSADTTVRNPPTDNPPNTYKRQSADTTVRRHDNPPTAFSTVKLEYNKLGYIEHSVCPTTCSLTNKLTPHFVLFRVTVLKD
jgi:hypothetical protein